MQHSLNFNPTLTPSRELLREWVKRGRPKKVPSGNHFRLADLGIDKKLSSRAQEIARIPERAFESYFRTARKAGWEITWGGENGLRYRAEADLYELARQRARHEHRAAYFGRHWEA